MGNGELPPDHAERMDRARLSLEGLSIGDAFGERFFFDVDDTFAYADSAAVAGRIARRALPRAPWPYTDDTEMAAAIVDELARRGRVEQDSLARSFAERHHREPGRGYGPTAAEILESIYYGASWRKVVWDAFGGEGSMGNGAAMRVAPLGAYFADDLDAVVSEARASAEVTHAHPQGKAGAIAVAVAAAMAWQLRGEPPGTAGPELLRAAMDRTPLGETRNGIYRAMQLSPGTAVARAAEKLGNGSLVTAPDTVPFCLWCAARHLDDYVEAMWNTVSALGDRDTTCAIVGGIVALSAGRESIPDEWLSAREPLEC